MASLLQLDPKTQLLDPVEALAAAGTAAWRWEIGSPVLDWSPGASAVLGLPEIVLRSPDLLLSSVDPDDLALVAAAGSSWALGRPVSAQVRIRLGGEVRWFDVIGRVVAGGPGDPDYATGTVRDVTEDREAQDALLEALHESEAALDHLRAVGEDAPAIRLADRVA